MEKFILTQLFRDTTTIKMFGNPQLVKKSHTTKQELDNRVDKFTMKVVKNNQTVGHLPCEDSQILWYFMARDGKICFKVTDCRRHCNQLCGGIEIPCRWVFSFSSKVKIYRLKELLESKIRRYTLEDTNGSFRSHHL